MAEKKEYLEKYINQSNKKNIPNVLPVIPTRSKMILYPNAVIPMFIGRDKSLNALEESLENNEGYLFFASQKEIEKEKISPKDLNEVGTVGRVVQISKLPSGEYKILAEGIIRAKTEKVVSKDKYYKFKINIMESKYKETKTLQALVRKIKQMFQKYMQLTKKFPQEAIIAIEETHDAEIISDLIASVLPIDLNEKFELLEILNTKKRLETELEILTREIELLEIEENLEVKVKEKIEKHQKEYFLREKLKEIKKELSYEEHEDLAEIREKINNIEFPEYVLEKINKELQRLNKMSQYSPEASVVRNYIDWLIEIPWNIKTKDNIEINEAKKILETNHHGLKEPKERILEFLSVRKLSSETRAPIICFVGAPGVGKTTLGKSIADALGRKFGRMSLGGVRDEAEIRGHRRTYVGAIPGRIVQTIRKLKSINPVIVLDEIDKLGASFQGDPGAALLEVLDPEQNKIFVDHYLEIPIDLSQTIFVTTANVIHTIPAALKDRMEVIYIEGYTDIEKYNIAKKYIIPKLLKEHGLKIRDLKITSNALKEIIELYTKEAGVRNLERQLAKIMRKSALKIVEENKEIKIRKDNLSIFLGSAIYSDSKKNENPEIGVATGLAWTAYGGTILDVEVLSFSGKGRLITTGKLGEIMKESAKISLSLSRKIAEDINIKCSETFDKNDFHLNLPEGAVPKDGPSAGVTLTTAIISNVLKKKIRHDIAMTGEITLRGKVLQVGGIKEKVLAAYRSGIKEVILPESNRKDVEKIPEEIRKKIKIYFAETIKEVLEIAFIGGINDEDKEC